MPGQLLLQESQRASAGILPDFGGKAMANAGVYLHLVRNPFFLEDFLQIKGFLHRNGLVGIPVQNEDRGKVGA